MRIKETEIDGRDGSIVEELGYESYTKTIVIGLRSDFDINEVIKYFAGEGDLVFSNEIDKVYKARIVEGIDFERLIRFKRASIKFLCQPFKYKRDEVFKETEVATASGTKLYLDDVYKVTSLKVEGEGGTINTFGKNLMNCEQFFRPSFNGLTSVLNADGSITTTGKVTSNYTAISQLRLDEFIVNGRTYTISQKSGGKINIQVNITDKNTNTSKYVIGKGSFVVDLEKNTYFASIQTGTVESFGTEPIDETNYYQIEEGTVATEFEPYKTASKAYKEGEKAVVEVFPPCTTIINTNSAEMEAEYIKPFEVFNEGIESSKPLMVLKGSGTVEISVNGTGIFTYTFPEGENEVVIDSEKEDAYLGSVLKNRNMNGEFPILLPKTNKIEWSGDVQSIEILPRSRWL
jgi:predicted phage tail component-like protein